jgi:hypothetical protein
MKQHDNVVFRTLQKASLKYYKILVFYSLSEILCRRMVQLSKSIIIGPRERDSRPVERHSRTELDVGHLRGRNASKWGAAQRGHAYPFLITKNIGGERLQPSYSPCVVRAKSFHTAARSQSLTDPKIVYASTQRARTLWLTGPQKGDQSCGKGARVSPCAVQVRGNGLSNLKDLGRGQKNGGRKEKSTSYVSMAN